MKKNSNISISSKGIISSKYFKVFVIILLIVMIAMSVVLIKVYLDINKKEIKKKNSAKNIITQMDKNIGDYTVFEDENGKLGVTDKEDRIIIEPYWEDIYVLSENRFIVSRLFGKEKKMGIIDSESNILEPFIFENFKSFSNEFIGGFTGEDNNFFLFDKNGNLLSDKMWTGYSYTNKVIYLNDNENEYRGEINSGDFRFIYVNISCESENVPYNIILTDIDMIDEVGIKNIDRIADITNKYIEYLITKDNDCDISDITSENYYLSLSSNDFFKECYIKEISDFSLDISEDKSTVLYKTRVVVNYDYSSDNIDAKNISSEIIFNIVKDENNQLILKSINKTEL